MSALLRIADSSRTSCEVRKVPEPDTQPALFNHRSRASYQPGRYLKPEFFG